METNLVSKRLQGFAAMDKEKQKEIASMGGKKAHELGRAHKFTSEEARLASSKRGKKKNGKKSNGN